MEPNARITTALPTPNIRRLSGIVGLAHERVLLVIMCVVLGGVAVLAYVVHRMQSDLVQHTAVETAQHYAATLDQFRSLYTSEVVDRLQKHDIEVTADYADKEGAIPLPATLTMMIGDGMKQHRLGAEIRLFSQHPFPWRKDGGPRDDFESEALRQLKIRPDQAFYRVEAPQGRPVLRYAKADLMRTSCVACHNSHPQSPKTDWKVGEVRGAIGVVVPLDNVMQHADSQLAAIFFAVTVLISLVLAVTFLHAIRIERALSMLVNSSSTEQLQLQRELVSKEMSSRSKKWPGILIVAVGLGIFSLDVVLPLGIAVGVCYVVFVLASWWSHRESATVYAAVGATTLCVLGYFVSGESPEVWMAIINRALSLIVIWLTAVIGVWHKRQSSSLVQIEREKSLAQSENAKLETLLHELRMSENSRKQLTSVIESTTDFVGVIDLEGHVRFVNHAGRTMVGITEAEEIANLTVKDFHPPSALEYLRTSALPCALFKGYWNGESVFLTRDGREIPVWMVVVAHKNVEGEVESVSTISRDMTKLKQAQQERDQLQQRLVHMARVAGMAEVATGVLHNVGNVLNSINVTANLLVEQVQGSRIASLVKASEVISQHQDDLPSFLTADDRGKHFPRLLEELASNLSDQRNAQIEELNSLIANIEHVKEIINMQQTHARAGGVSEQVDVVALVEDALTINDAALIRHSVEVVRQFAEAPTIITEKHKVLQILVNLISNAKYALSDCDREDKTMTLVVDAEDECLRILVSDNGVGIPDENLTKIFAHGFTTKMEGHGFGLHSSALAAQELGGSLSVHSDGLGKGATFTLRLSVKKEMACEI